MPIANA